MSWRALLGHAELVERVRRAMARRRLASTFLLVGPHGVGKRTFAQCLAESLLCEVRAPTDLDACGRCISCQQIAAGSHPDLFVVRKPPDKSFIPVELLIGDREHRRREGLCYDLSRKSFRGGYKVAILDDADYLNEEGANCLLKTLEEPPAKSVIMLLGTSEQRQLPTIRSRCQVLRFGPLAHADVCRLLRDQQRVADDEEACRLADLADGSLAQALEYAEPEARELRSQLLNLLSQNPRDWIALSREVQGLVEQSGKDASAKRSRLAKIIELMTDFHQAMLYHLTGMAAPRDPELRQAVESGRRAGPWEVELFAEGLARCTEARRELEANAHAPTLIDCWIDDLAQIHHGQPRPTWRWAESE